MKSVCFMIIMAMSRGWYLHCSTACRIFSLNFSTSCISNNKWRKQQGLEANPRVFGPLTNLRDYSFVDGRPTILTRRQLNKIRYQESLAEKVFNLTQEIDVGLQQYYKRMERKKQKRELILKSKLKPKGAALLTNSKSNSTS